MEPKLPRQDAQEEGFPAGLLDRQETSHVRLPTSIGALAPELGANPLIKKNAGTGLPSTTLAAPAVAVEPPPRTPRRTGRVTPRAQEPAQVRLTTTITVPAVTAQPARPPGPGLST